MLANSRLSLGIANQQVELQLVNSGFIILTFHICICSAAQQIKPRRNSLWYLWQLSSFNYGIIFGSNSHHLIIFQFSTQFGIFRGIVGIRPMAGSTAQSSSLILNATARTTFLCALGTRQARLRISLELKCIFIKIIANGRPSVKNTAQRNNREREKERERERGRGKNK